MSGLLDDLIAESKALAVKDKKAKTATAAQAKKEKEQAILRSQYLPNAVAAESPDWEPQYQTVQIVDQECDECKNVTSYIGGYHIHSKHKRLKAWREISAPLSEHLPTHIRRHRLRTPMCVTCLNIIQVVDEFFAEGVKVQRELF